MDENLILYAIQNKNFTNFENRYSIYPTEEKRDEIFRAITMGQIDEAEDKVCRVNLIVRVETERDLI